MIYKADIEVIVDENGNIFTLKYKDQVTMTREPEEILQLIMVMYRVQAQQDNACGDCG